MANHRSREHRDPFSHQELEKEVRINKKLTYFAHWATTSGVH